MANMERLKHLVTVLKKVEGNRFNLLGWYLNKSDVRIFHQEEGKEIHPECGTVACIAGWAALDPEFNAQGFHPEYDTNGEPVSIELESEVGFICGVSALEEFFGLSYEEVNDVFYMNKNKPNYGDEGLAVAIAKIEALIEKHSA